MVTLDKSKILVTGCSGYIGSHLRNKISFIGLDRRSSFKDEQGALEEFDPLKEHYQGVEVVVHLADRRLQDISAENLHQNILMHRQFLEKLKRLPQLKKVIFSSSCSVYGFSDVWVDETSVVNPTSAYAESKLAVESLLYELNLPHLILRFGTAYGWSPVMREDLFVNEIAKTAAQGGVIDIYSAEAWRPYVHCRDFAEILSRAVTTSWRSPLNVVTENFTKSQILDLPVLKESRLRPQVSAKGDPRDYKVRINSELLSQPVTMSQGLQEMLGRYE